MYVYEIVATYVAKLQLTSQFGAPSGLLAKGLTSHMFHSLDRVSKRIGYGHWLGYTHFLLMESSWTPTTWYALFDQKA